MNDQYPFDTLRGAFALAADELLAALHKTDDSFRGEDGADHAPPGFAGAAEFARQAVDMLRLWATTIGTEADRDRDRYYADDEYWGRDK